MEKVNFFAKTYCTFSVEKLILGTLLPGNINHAPCSLKLQFVITNNVQPTFENDKNDSVVIIRLLNLLRSPTIFDISRALQNFKFSSAAKLDLHKVHMQYTISVTPRISSNNSLFQICQLPIFGVLPITPFIQNSDTEVTNTYRGMKPTLKCFFIFILITLFNLIIFVYVCWTGLKRPVVFIDGFILLINTLDQKKAIQNSKQDCSLSMIIKIHWNMCLQSL
jgi:hypothetical protein